MVSTPKRRIIQSAGQFVRRRTGRGLVMTAVLECGHVDDCNATERRRGWLYCFDCMRGKPADPIGSVVVEEQRC